MVWCVRSDLVVQSDFNDERIWEDEGSGAKTHVGIWSIKLPTIPVNGSDKLPVLADMFWCNYGYDRPSTRDAKVLAIPCPKEFRRFNAQLPSFTKEDIPYEGDIFNELSQCDYKLPFTVFFSSTDGASVAQIAHPFIKLGRRTAWTVNEVHRNNSGGEISDKTSIKRGISTTETDEMKNSAGINVSSSFGLFGVGIEVSLNY